jgi:probable F420-dependent oxidoreductase
MPLSNGFAATRGTLRDIAALAAEAETLGYESVWVAEVAGYDAISTLMAAAAATSSIRLATGIAGVYLRDPLLAAMSANAINEYADGRLLLGLGTSTEVIVQRWHGIPWRQPLVHMRAHTEILRRLLAGERVTSESGPYRLRGAQLTVPSAGQVPIVFGALGPKMLALAGEIADGVLFNFPSLSYARQAAATVRVAAVRAGRDPSSVPVYAFLRTTVTDAPEAMLPRYQSEMLTYVMAPVYQRVFTTDGYGDVVNDVQTRWTSGDRDGALAAIDERMVHEHNVIGDAASCRAQFDAFRAAGVDCPIVFPIPESEDADAALASIYSTIIALAPSE